MTVTQIVNNYLQDLAVGGKFGTRDICQYIYTKTLGAKNPLDGTVSRMVRAWREENDVYDIICVDYKKAIYQKVRKDSTQIN